MLIRKRVGRLHQVDGGGGGDDCHEVKHKRTELSRPRSKQYFVLPSNSGKKILEQQIEKWKKKDWNWGYSCSILQYRNTRITCYVTPPNLNTPPTESHVVWSIPTFQYSSPPTPDAASACGFKPLHILNESRQSSALLCRKLYFSFEVGLNGRSLPSRPG